MQTTTVPQRETAKICSIKDLLKGDYIIQEGWKPNYVQVGGRKLSRINIIGIVVSKPTPYEFSLDDGTGTIDVTDFNQHKKVADLKVGEPVLVIGRPRQNNNQLFIACEFVNSKQLKENSYWLSQRKKDLEVISTQTDDDEPISLEDLEFSTPQDKTEEIIEKAKEVNVIDESQAVVADVTGEDIIQFIKKKDTGDGCFVEEIISYFGDDIDDHILTLITMGEIYEIKPGKVKVLE